MRAPEATSFLPYVPRDRYRAAAAGRELPDRTEGAALFADLSGFTKLTQALVDAYGPNRGAEELTRYLALAYEALIGPVHAHGGSVVGFSGDAITCWFDGDDGRAATAAGFDMQLRLAGVPPALSGRKGEVALAVKVAVASGPARRFLVGDPAVQTIDVLAGRTLDQLAAIEKLTKPGEVVVSQGVASALPGLDGTSREGDHGRVWVLQSAPRRARQPATSSLRPGGFDGLASWVLPAVQQRLSTDDQRVVADFRPSAALFLAFQGIDVDDDPEAGAKLDTFIRWVQGVVARLDGALIQLTFGDKGSYLYCSFGAPVAHDDDAARAVAAGRMLVDPPQPFIRDVRVGVTHGQMYAGAYGSAERCTFGVLGPKTNLAARLMGVAEPGQVLCDEAIARQAARRWAFRPLPPVEVKGVPDPVPVFEPDAPLEASGARATIVGRELELAAIRTALDDLVAGRPQTIWMQGDAGFGKSRLLDAIADEAAVRDAACVRASEHVWGREAPYRPWRPFVKRLLGVPDGDEPNERDVVAAVGRFVPELEAWSPLLGDVFGLDMAPTDLTRDLAPDTRNRNLLLLLTELTRVRTGERPWVYLIDEAQHLDSVSWDLAVTLAKAAADRPWPLLTVVAYRPRELDARAVDALERWRAAVPGAHLVIGALDDQALGALLAERFEVPEGGLPSELVEFVGGRASGNPFFAQELVQTMLEDGTVQRRSDGRWRFDARSVTGSRALPTSLHGLVLARIDRAPAPAARTLKVAAVAGRVFSAEAVQVATLGAGSSADAQELASRLDALLARDLLAEEPPEGYRFHHPTVHHVAYESLLFGQRRSIHAALTAWHEDGSRLPESERTALLAHHSARAAAGSGDDDLIDRAVGHLEAAAHQNERLSAFSEAAAAFRIALDLLSERSTPSTRRPLLLVRLGDMHERLGAFEEAEAYFRDALDAGPDRSTEGAAWASLCLVRTRRGRYEQAREAGAEALNAAADVGDAGLVALVRGRLGILSAMQGDLENAAASFEAAREHYVRAGQMRNAAAWSNNIGLGLVFQERYDDAEERLQEALAMTREHTIPEIEAQVLMNLGLCAHKQGRLDDAAERYRASLALCRTLLAREDAVINAINLGDVALAKGDHEGAWAAFIDTAREAWEIGAAPRALDALRGAAEVLATRGRYQDAAELVGFVRAHPACNAEVEGELERAEGMVASGLSPSAMERAYARGAEHPLEEMLERWSSFSAA